MEQSSRLLWQHCAAGPRITACAASRSPGGASVDALPHVRSPAHPRTHELFNSANCAAKLAKARADYIALLPAGKRIVWDLA